MNRTHWLLIALAACNSSSTPSPDHTDAQAADTATADTPWPIDAAPPITLHATSLAGDGTSDTTAIAVYPDLGGTVQTATIGFGLNVMVPEHATVTVLQEATGSDGVIEDHYTTFIGTESDDDLIAGPARRQDVPTGNAVTMSVTLPADHLGATVYSECGALTPTNGSATLTLYDSCGADPFNVLAIDGSAAPPVFGWQTNEMVTGGGSLAITDTFNVFDPLALSIANVPAGLTRLEAHDEIVLGAISALSIPLDDQSLASPPAGSASLTMRYPLGAGDSTFVVAREFTGSDDLRDVAVSSTTSSTNFALDLAAQPLPTVALPTRTSHGLTWTETPAGSPSSRIVTWHASWHDPNGAEHDLTWIVIDDPANPPTMTLPTLPAVVAAYDPFAASDLVLGTYGVEYVAYSSFGGYRAGRRFGETLADVTTPYPGGGGYSATASRSPAP
jgi:hypothetical protein